MQYHKITFMVDRQFVATMAVDNAWLLENGHYLPDNIEIELIESDDDTISSMGRFNKKTYHSAKEYVEKQFGPGFDAKATYTGNIKYEPMYTLPSSCIMYRFQVKYPLNLSPSGLEYAKTIGLHVEFNDIEKHYSDVFAERKPKDLQNMVIELAEQGIVMDDAPDGGLKALIRMKHYWQIQRMLPKFNTRVSSEILKNKDKLAKQAKQAANRIKKRKEDYLTFEVFYDAVWDMFKFVHDQWPDIWHSVELRKSTAVDVFFLLVDVTNNISRSRNAAPTAFWKQFQLMRKKKTGKKLKQVAEYVNQWEKKPTKVKIGKFIRRKKT